MTPRTLPLLLSATALLAAAQVSQAATLFFDFGGAGAQAGAPYNNVNPANLAIADAIDSGSTLTGIGLVAAGFNLATTNADGPRIPAAGAYPAPTGSAAIFASQATTDSMIGNNANFGTPFTQATLIFSGLDQNTRYTFDFFASRCNVTAIDIRETQYSVAGLSTTDVFLDAVNNASNIATVSSMAPTAAGTITVTIDAGPNNNNPNQFFYLNALRLTTAAVPEPSAALLAGLGAATAFRRRRAVR